MGTGESLSLDDGSVYWEGAEEFDLMADKFEPVFWVKFVFWDGGDTSSVDFLLVEEFSLIALGDVLLMMEEEDFSKDSVVVFFGGLILESVRGGGDLSLDVVLSVRKFSTDVGDFCIVLMMEMDLLWGVSMISFVLISDSCFSNEGIVLSIKAEDCLSGDEYEGGLDLVFFIRNSRTDVGDWKYNDGIMDG